MKRLMLLVVLMAGCASQSGVIADGKDAFIVIASDNGWTSAGDLKISAYQEANAYCTKLNKQFESISEQVVQAGVLSKYSEVDVRFRCVAN